jgi:uncharacterized small protein (DUF1192 family)
MAREDLRRLGVWELSSRLQILSDKLHGIDEYEHGLRDDIDRINVELARRQGVGHEEKES